MSSKSKRRRTPLGSAIELIVIVAVALGLALLIQAFLIKPYRIPSASMEPTLDIGQRVLVDRFMIDFSDPEVGQIVVFNPPTNAQIQNASQCGVSMREGQACPRSGPKRSEENFIKRIVAGPGDTLSVRGGKPVRNGKIDPQDYETEPCGTSAVCNLPVPIKVPAGQYYMMGDNRGESDDSRFWGPVPKEWIIGDAFATYWPPDRIGFL